MHRLLWLHRPMREWQYLLLVGRPLRNCMLTASTPSAYVLSCFPLSCLRSGESFAYLLSPLVSVDGPVLPPFDTDSCLLLAARRAGRCGLSHLPYDGHVQAKRSLQCRRRVTRLWSPARLRIPDNLMARILTSFADGIRSVSFPFWSKC